MINQHEGHIGYKKLKMKEGEVLHEKIGVSEASPPQRFVRIRTQESRHLILSSTKSFELVIFYQFDNLRLVYSVILPIACDTFMVSCRAKYNRKNIVVPIYR